jgi:hypothetical protein
MGQALPQVPLPLLGAVPRDGIGLGGAILLPVAGMVGAPLAGAVAADLTILRIEGQLPLAVLASALPLAWLVRTGDLLGVKSGRLELSLAETATPAHAYRVAAFSLQARYESSRPVQRHLPVLQGSELAMVSPLELSTGKKQKPSGMSSSGAHLNGLAG